MTHEQLADRYLLDEELGRGSSATVYLARDLRHGHRVALKVMHSALGQALGVSTGRLARALMTGRRHLGVGHLVGQPVLPRARRGAR